MLRVEACSWKDVKDIVLNEHYAHRRPPISFCFALRDNERVVGALTFGVPASRHLQISACRSDPSKVIELNRLVVASDQPRNTESWFVSRTLALLPPRIVVSYADTAQGHLGYVYRAANFLYSGWTDMDRKTPRFDYVVAGKHSRAAFRSGHEAEGVIRVRRLPKIKYWTVTGNRKERHTLMKLATWPSLSWKTLPPPVGNI